MHIVKKVAIVDGVAMSDLDIYRIRSAPFDIILPDNNVIEATPGHTRAVSDGYWVFLQPLAPGKHKICAIGSCSSGKTKVDVTFNVNVTE